MSNVNLNNTDNNDYVRGYKDGKKAGVLHEADRSQGLADALEEIDTRINVFKSGATYKIEMIKPIVKNAPRQIQGGK
jgi:D-arabinose 5-phosphate isomerase GutQ